MLELPIDAALPPKLVAACRGRIEGTVGDLLGHSPEALRAQRHLVRRDWEDISTALRAVPPDRLDVHPHWLDLFRALLADLLPRERWVIERLSGLVGPPSTLAELGELTDVSRQRVQQMEAVALRKMRGKSGWTRRVAERLDAAFDGWVRTVRELGTLDAFFTVDESVRDAFVFFVNVLVGARVAIALLGDGIFASRFPATALEHLSAKLREAIRSLRFPIAADQLESALLERLGWDRGLVRDLVQCFDGRFLRNGDLLMGLSNGRRRRPSVVAVLRASSRPLDATTIAKQWGRPTKLPPGIIAIGHGVFTLPEKVPDWTACSERLAPLCRSILEEGPRRRQWTTAELLAILRQRTELPMWCNEWSLGALLRLRHDVRWLGRNVIALPSEPRIDVRRAAIHILQRHGRPMKLERLFRTLRARRGVSWLSVHQLQYVSPFVAFEDRLIGLSPRDVPDAHRTIERIVRSVLRRLEKTERVRVRDVARTLGIDFKLVGSLLRHDARFAFSAGSVVRSADGN